jgi:hypothetical protein
MPHDGVTLLPPRRRRALWSTAVDRVPVTELPACTGRSGRRGARRPRAVEPAPSGLPPDRAGIARG